MNFKYRPFAALVLTIATLVLVSTRLPADTGTCGGAMVTLPFTDVSGNILFCQIAEAYFSGLTLGTTPTTYSPDDFVRRDQMAAFVSRTQDSALRRGSRRAALGQWATPTALPITSRTDVGNTPEFLASDGLDLWVAEFNSSTVKRVRASDGTVLATWFGALQPMGVLVARGRVYVTGYLNPQGSLYLVNPNPPTLSFNVTTLSNALGGLPRGITTDGAYLWTANEAGSLSRIDPDTGVTTNITTGFGQPKGILFDGSNLWVTDATDATLKKLDSSGAILQSIPMGNTPFNPVFDGSNIWVPNQNSSSVIVVRARDGLVLATFTGNGLTAPIQAAFDGQRILVTNFNGNSVSLWNAADLTPLGNFATGAGTGPFGVCSDGINFWITLQGSSQLARF